MNFLLRNLKNGELTLLNVTILLAIFSLTVTLFFTEGLRATLLDKTGILMGGDRVITSPNNLDPIFNIQANDLGLKTSESIIFLSMLLHKEDLALAEVKAVDNHYPLKGVLQGTDDLFGKEQDFNDIPEPGTVWLETNLFTLLNLAINDIVKIGEANFRVTRVVTFEPDRGGQGLSFAPRALMNIKDVEKTKVIQTGSRQSYKLALTGSRDALARFDAFVGPMLTPLQSYKTAGKEQPILDRVFTQAKQYLTIVLIINILFACIAISQAIRRFCLRQYNTVAILRCFGAPFRWIIRRFIIEILVVGFIFAFIGFGLAALFFNVTKNYIETPLYLKMDMLWSMPVVIALICFLFLLLFFGLPPIFKLKNVSALHILRKNIKSAMLKPVSSKQSPNIPSGRFTPFALFSKLLNPRTLMPRMPIPKMLISGIRVPSQRIAKLLKPFPKLSVACKYGLANISRYSTQNIIQTIAFSLVMTGAFLLFFIHIDLIQSFRAQTPANAPNFFAINIDPTEVKDFATALTDADIATQVLYPVVRARLLSINNIPVAMDEASVPNQQNTQNTQKRIPRLLNLSYIATLPPENEITSGKFFTKDDFGLPVVSLEQGFAERMEIKLNDELSFLIAEKTFTVKVTSIRHVNWDSFNPNFFVLFPPGVLDKFPTTYMTSFHVPNNNRKFLKPLVERFPSVNLIDITMVLKQAEGLIKTVSFGIQFLLLYSGLMAILMLFASLYSHLDERKQDALLFRILGASKQTVSTILLTEFAILGFVAGVIATVSAYAIYLWLAMEVFKIASVNAWHWLVLGPIVGIVFICFMAWLMLRKIIRLSPKMLLTARRI